MTETNTQRFEIKDDAGAEWALRKIREAERDRAMWKAHYEEQLKKVNEAADATVDYMTALLADYFETVPHKSTKTQESYQLPTAKLVRKQQQPKFDIDEERACAWLFDNGYQNMLKAKVCVNWAELKKVVSITPDGTSIVDDNGVIVEGVTVTMRPDVFKVEMEGIGNE